MTPANTYPVRSPYDGAVIGEAHESSEADVREAIARASAARGPMAALTAYQRGAILDKISDLLAANVEAIARLMAGESGKPMRYSRGEVKRAVETFAFAADEARRLHGETIPLDAAQTGAGKTGWFVRVPVGVIAAITPFNFPLNLVAHKVAPAIAAGCPLVLKPNPQTPLTAIRLMELAYEAGLPEGALSVVNGGADVGRWMTTDPRVQMITFTGSVPVAKVISQTAGLRRTTFELGGNAATIIDETADIDSLIEKTVAGAFAYSGQVCISIQRIYIQQGKYNEFRDKFVARVNKLVLGDPLQEGTEIGPLINDGAASRIAAWIAEAESMGARVLAGGSGDGRMFQPTVLEGVDTRMKVMCEEVFGPVVNLVPFDKFEDALAAVNDSDFGLQAGVFTQNLSRAMQAARVLDVGGVIINDSPTFRVDQMPYGGNKNSGVGREGPRFAVEDMTTLKMIVIS
ncbi:MAG: aldehyde dehydrogenase family protein [Pleurocapsa minor GSE-CHR-MK-17-07R]|jgi:acyl-CoA reductase-like NAD-dependent aldehyde dehydrogenase|nr:aldehyde dehydrogenase family protein [Pleurocapsa minor GSE-CHR-MK 17-07R]